MCGCPTLPRVIIACRRDPWKQADSDAVQVQFASASASAVHHWEQGRGRDGTGWVCGVPNLALISSSSAHGFAHLLLASPLLLGCLFAWVAALALGLAGGHLAFRRWRKPSEANCGSPPGPSLQSITPISRVGFSLPLSDHVLHTTQSCSTGLHLQLQCSAFTT